jgi:ferrous iron transport protein A
MVWIERMRRPFAAWPSGRATAPRPSLDGPPDDHEAPPAAIALPLAVAVDCAPCPGCRPFDDAAAGRPALPLALATEGARLRIDRFLGGCAMTQRLTDMGLYVGSEVRIAQRHGGQLVVVRGETRLALGAGLAHKILVAPIAEAACAP